MVFTSKEKYLEQLTKFHKGHDFEENNDPDSLVFGVTCKTCNGSTIQYSTTESPSSTKPQTTPDFDDDDDDEDDDKKD